jgi:molecular chaperone GrpE
MAHRSTKPAAPPALDALQAEVAALKQGWQRTQADFENFRRRTAAEQQGRIETALGQRLLVFVPIAENLRRALTDRPSVTSDSTSTDRIQAWTSGIESIAHQFDQALSAAGISPIDPSPGTAFDPREHEALAHQPHVDHGHDTVIQVVERGYKAGNQVLTPAKVIVSSGSDTPPATKE